MAVQAQLQALERFWPPVQSQRALGHAVVSGRSPHEDCDTGIDGKRYCLTNRQERFCRIFADGQLKLADAYLQAGYAAHTRNRKTVRENASRLLRQPKIRRRVAQVRTEVLATEEALGAGIRTFVQEGLMDLADNAASITVRLKALEQLGRMAHVQMFEPAGRVCR